MKMNSLHSWHTKLAHVIAEHSAEQLSRLTLGYLLLGPFLPVVGLALLIEKLAPFIQFPQLGVTFVSDALSRIREREADYIGMLLMTEAGFHPRGAVTFFRKMNAIEDFLKKADPETEAHQSEFLSTHPHVSQRPTFTVDACSRVSV